MNLYSDFSNESLKQKYLVTKLHELNNKKNRSEDNYQNKNEIELPQKASDQRKASEQMKVDAKDEVGLIASDNTLANDDYSGSYSDEYIEYDNKNELELPQKASDQGKTSEQMIVEVKDEVGQFASDENLASNDYSEKYIEYDEFFEENIVDNERLENENLPFKDYPISFHSHSINKTD